MSVFLLGNSYIVGGKVPFKACLLGATFLVSAAALAGAAKADDGDADSKADVFTSWVNEDELRAKVAEVAKADQAAEIAPAAAAPQIEQVAEVIILENQGAANDNYSSDMLAAVDEGDIIEMVKVAVVDKPLYAPSPAEASARAVADNSFETFKSPASPNDYKKYGSMKSPWIDPSITLSEEEKAVAMGDINAYFAFEKKPLGANPTYGEALGNEQGVEVLPLASSDKVSDDAMRTPKTMATSQIYSDFDNAWNSREEASGWIVAEANAADTTLEDILKQGTEGGAAAPDWLAGTNGGALPAAAPATAPAAVATPAPATAPAPASAPAPVPAYDFAPAPAVSAPAFSPVPAGAPADTVAGNNAITPFGDTGAGYAINVPAPITLSADMNISGGKAATAAPSQPLLVPLDTMGPAGEDSGFGSGFGYDDTPYNTYGYGAYGNEYATSYSQGYFAPQAGVAPAPMPASVSADASSDKKDVVDTVKDWFGSILSAGGEGKKLDDAVSQYTKRHSGKKVEKVTAAPSQIRLTFEKGSSDVSADTVKWLRSFATKAVADGRKAAEVIISGKNLRLQSRRFALVRNVLVGYGFDAEDVKPSLSGADDDVLTVNTFSSSRSSGGQGSMNAMGGSF